MSGSATETASSGQERTLRTPDGLDLHYRVVGDGPRDVLLSHGLTSTGDLEWRYLLPLLTPSSRCLVPDLRGHGRSDHSDRHGWEVVAADLRALLVAEGVERPHLVGFSFGSEVLLQLAVQEPALPASLTLMGTSTGRPAAFRQRPPGPPQGPMEWPGALRRAHEGKHGPDHWEVLVRGMAGRWQARDEHTDGELARVRCPTLLVMGEHEVPFKLAQARHLAGVLPDARLVEFPDVGHEVHIAERGAVGALVLEHLERADR